MSKASVPSGGDWCEGLGEGICVRWDPESRLFVCNCSAVLPPYLGSAATSLDVGGALRRECFATRLPRGGFVVVLYGYGVLWAPNVFLMRFHPIPHEISRRFS